MTAHRTKVSIEPRLFGRQPRELLVHGALRVELFRYGSGVHGLRIENGVGHVEVLPFVGQQVWRAHLHGRQLAMTSTFDDPVNTTDYLAGNGGYLAHCGGSAMGNPGPDDEHPLHGELPYARHDGVHLDVGEGAVTVRGGFTHRVSFGPYFAAETSLTVTEGSGLMQSRARITNLSRDPRVLMYLAHLNFRPAVGGAIIDAVPAGPAASRTRADFEWNGKRTSASQFDEARTSIDRLLEPGTRVEPEIVQTLPSRADAEGWVTTRQRHVDGSQDLVSHRSADLTHTLRWLRRSADDDAFGFALPATAEADGLSAETRKGHVRRYEPTESLLVHITHGAITAAEAARTEWNTA